MALIGVALFSFAAKSKKVNSPFDSIVITLQAKMYKRIILQKFSTNQATAEFIQSLRASSSIYFIEPFKDDARGKSYDLGINVRKGGEQIIYAFNFNQQSSSQLPPGVSGGEH